MSTIFVPDDFYCPITGELMKEPVSEPDGHTYEKNAIEKWVMKNGTSPMTRKNINISDLGLVDIKSEDHVFVASVLGKFMDHKKGDRKQNKWSNELLYRIKKEMNN